MRYIQKGQSPVSLEKFKLHPGADYEILGSEPDVKNELRIALLAEQGYTCAYCGSKIDEEHSVIEHIKCRQRYPHLQLGYSNMVCSCYGGQKDRQSGNPKYPLYCDAAKENKDIAVTPLDKECSSLFLFDDNGGIYDNNSPDANLTIKILNLDNPILKNKRNAAIDAYRGLSDAIDWNAEIQNLYSSQSSGKFAEFCFVIEYYIKSYKMAADAL